MKVDNLFIVCILADNWTSNGDTEIFPGGEALYEKYIARAMPAERVTLIQVDYRDKKTISYARGTMRGPTKDGTTGVYIFGHGGDGMVGGLSPTELASLIKTDLTIDSIFKLALVSCASAVSNSDEGPFLKQFCEALRKEQLYPKVAGWDGYITICSSTTDHEVYAPLTEEETKTALKGQKYTKHEMGKIPDRLFGRKVARTAAKKYTMVDDNLRDKFKHFWQVTSTEVVNIAREGWTQREK